MIKPEHIPDEAVDAMLESIGSFFCRAEARAACAAALNAWPGAMPKLDGRYYLLSLTQEPRT